MADFNVRSDSVNVEQIMAQIRDRIRVKRGADYTEAEIRELARVKLEKFLEPGSVRSDLLAQFRRLQPPYQPPEVPNYAFEDQTLFESTRGVLRSIRRLLRPILKLFFNPNPLIQALHIQSRLNTIMAERATREEASRHATEHLFYEILHNLVVEMTRMSIEVKNLKMRGESLAGRLEFNERRARALESVVAYKPSNEPQPRERAPQPPPQPQAPPPFQAPPRPAAAPEAAVPVVGAQSGAPAAPEGPGQRSRRRRRRRGRRGLGPAATAMVPGQAIPAPATGPEADSSDFDDAEHDDEAQEAPPLGEHPPASDIHPAEPAVAFPEHAPAPAAQEISASPATAEPAAPAPTADRTSDDPGPHES
jgi:hypothetical protein